MLLILLIPVFAFGQGLKNSGAKIIVKDGAKVYVDGDANGSITINSGDITFTGATSEVLLEGNWVNQTTTRSILKDAVGALDEGIVTFCGAGNSQFITGTQATIFSNVKVNSNSNLSLGAPLTSVLFQHVVETYNLTNYGVFNVPVKQALTVNGKLTNETSGSFHLKGDKSTSPTGSLLTKGGLENKNAENMFFERYFSLNNHHFVATPMTLGGVKNSDFSGGTIGIYGGGAAPTDLLVGSTYDVLYTTDHNPISFSGTFNDNNVPTVYGYWVGNPYPSAIDFELLQANSGGNLANWYSTFVDGVMKTFTIGGAYSNYSKYIPAMNGVYTYCFGGFDFKNDYRSHGNQNYYKGTKLMDFVRIDLQNGENIDNTSLYSDINATDAFDSYFLEAPVLLNEAPFPGVYSRTADNEEVKINAFKEIYDGLVVPLNILCNNEGDYTISAPEIKLMNTNLTVFLEDKFNGELVDLGMTDYTFKSARKEYKDRFALHFSTPIEEKVNTPGYNEGEVDIYSYGQTVYVNVKLSLDKEATVSVIDVLGKKVMDKKIVKTGLTGFVLNKPTGTYIIKTCINGKYITKKVFIN